MNIAYLGIPGSYSYLAAINYFGSDTNLIGMKSFEEIFDSVSTNYSTFGIVPLENTISGSIYQSYDLMIETDLKIIGEIILKLKHCLLVKKGLKGTANEIINKIKKCYSHPEIMKHCHNFFLKNRQIKTEFCQDSASAAKLLHDQKDLFAAAISNRYCAKLNGFRIVSDKIQDNPNNYTRFVVIGSQTQKIGDKASIVFSLEHKPGSLVKALESYAKLGLDLTKIESRPIAGKPWEYIFLVDFEIDGKENELSLLLSMMRKKTNFIKVLGRYHKGGVYET